MSSVDELCIRFDSWSSKSSGKCSPSQLVATLGQECLWVVPYQEYWVIKVFTLKTALFIIVHCAVSEIHILVPDVLVPILVNLCC